MRPCPETAGTHEALLVAHERRRVRIRAWVRDNADALAESANHPDIARFLRDRFPYPYTRNDAEAFLTQLVPTAPALFRAIEVDGWVAGGLGLHPGEDVERHSAEIGYWLTPRLWRQGIMTAVLQAYVPHAMAQFGLVRLWAKVYAPNAPSIRLLERCGFEREGILRRAVLKQGRFLDAILYARIDGQASVPD